MRFALLRVPGERIATRWQKRYPPAFRLYRKGVERENLPGSGAGRVPSWAPNFCWHFWKRPNVWLSSPHRPASSPWGYFYISLQTGLLPTFEKRGPAPSIRRRPAAKKGVCKMSKSTVFPTRDRPWLRFYAAGADRVAINVPQGLTIWQFVEKEMRRLGDGTAIEYFGRKITRKEFVRQVERWACVFHNLGVQEEEVPGPIGKPSFTRWKSRLPQAKRLISPACVCRS